VTNHLQEHKRIPFFGKRLDGYEGESKLIPLPEEGVVKINCLSGYAIAKPTDKETFATTSGGRGVYRKAMVIK
jgi:hypothetical protein